MGVEIAVAVGGGGKVGANEGIGAALGDGSGAIEVAGEQAFKHSPAKKTTKIQWQNFNIAILLLSHKFPFVVL
jgi:hypothetical protein